jgi:hypothetical protein
MMKKLKQLLYTALFICTAVSCQTIADRTTTVYGTVKDEQGLPVKGVELEIAGEKGTLTSHPTLLKTVYSDSKGEYTITAEIPTEYHSAKINNRWFTDLDILQKYTGYSLYFNGNSTKDCCRLDIGKKNEYSFVMIKK